jgi:hypothetical protein
MSTTDAAIASEEIDRWFQSANRLFTPLDPGVRVSLEVQLRKLQETVSSRRWPDIAGILAHS